MFVLGLLFWAVLPECPFRFRFPGLISLWSYCLLSAMFCPTMYAMGWEGPGRVQNIIFCAYLLLLALNLFYWLGWLSQRLGSKEHTIGPKLLPTLCALTLCLVLLAISAALRGAISLASAYTALSDGQAATYYQPYLLFFDDLYEPDSWQNRDMANYYEKDCVILISEDAS